MIEKFNEILAGFGIITHQDKVLHAIVGFLIGVIGMATVDGWAVVLVFIAAVGKELWDEYRYGGFDFFDMFVTLLAGWIGIMLMGLIGF